MAFGGIVLSVTQDDSAPGAEVDVFHQPFLSTASPDVVLRSHYVSGVDVDFDELAFDTGDSWALYKHRGRPLIRMPSNGKLSRYAVLASDWLSGDIYQTIKWDVLPPLSYPLEELLIINLLPKRQGILLHASAVKVGGRGLLFGGMSGAGKSTLAALWERHAGATVLSDDRVIVREIDGQFWSYGTPWHGSARLASPERVPLERIFLIHHAAENSVRKLHPARAVSGLLARAFPPFWDAEGMQSTLEFLERLVASVPCYALGFVPEAQTLDFIRAVG
jgi:hypothetical protein